MLQPLKPVLDTVAKMSSPQRWETLLYRKVMPWIKDSRIGKNWQEAYEKRIVADAATAPTPESLIFYVNMRCNAKCPHCFIWNLLNTGINELKLPEIEKIVGSLERPVRLLLTGGEPFLRQDLFDIAYAFEKRGKLQSLQIVTNASLPSVIEKFIKRWLAETDKSISMQISVDGLEKTHDAIRQIPKGFQKILQTIEILKQFPKERVGIKTSSVVHKKNIGEVPKLIRFFKKRDVYYKFTIMRSNSFSTFGLPRHILSGWDPKAEMIALTPAEIVALVRKVDKEFPGCLDAGTRAKLLLTSLTLDKKKRLIPCFAGSLEAVIHANGDVSHCEQVKPFGNLKETDFDFKKLWWSDKADKQRPIIKKCSCIHGCNLWTSIDKTQRDVFYTRLVV